MHAGVLIPVCYNEIVIAFDVNMASEWHTVIVTLMSHACCPAYCQLYSNVYCVRFYDQMNE